MRKLIFLCLVAMFSICSCNKNDNEILIARSKIDGSNTLFSVDSSMLSSNNELKIIYHEDTVESDIPTEIDTDDPTEAYYAFMRGDILGVHGKTGEKFTLNDFLSSDNKDSRLSKYAFFDFSKDGVIDLIIEGDTIYGFKIFTFKDKHIVFFDSGSQYETILSNGAFLYHRSEIPYYERYSYRTAEIEIDFEISYPYTEEGKIEYYFQGQEVTELEWKELAKPYLSIQPADIFWYEIDKD